MSSPMMLMTAVMTAAHNFLDFSFSSMVLYGWNFDVCDDVVAD